MIFLKLKKIEIAKRFIEIDSLYIDDAFPRIGQSGRKKCWPNVLKNSAKIQFWFDNSKNQLAIICKQFEKYWHWFGVN